MEARISLCRLAFQNKLLEVLQPFTLRDLVIHVVFPFVDCEDEWKDLVIREVVGEIWDSGDLYSLYRPQYSSLRILDSIQTFRRHLIIRSGTFKEEELAERLIHRSDTRVQFVQELHGYTAYLEAYYSFERTVLYQHESWRPMSLKKLLNLGEKLPVNESDVARIHNIHTKIDPTRNFIWSENRCKNLDVIKEEDPRGYRYKYGHNIYAFTCDEDNPFKWKFLYLETLT